MDPDSDLDDDVHDARGQRLSDLLDAFEEGEQIARSVSEGGEPDLDKLERLAQAMEDLRIGVENGTLWFGWVRPTEVDVKIAEHLVELVRRGAPREALMEPGRHVHRTIADPGALYSVGGILLWLAGEPCEDEPLAEDVRATLDRAVASFERGGNVAGFAPGPEDVARIRRLRELVDEGDSEERRRLASEQWARYPRDNVTDGIRRITVRSEPPTGSSEG